MKHFDSTPITSTSWNNLIKWDLIGDFLSQQNASSSSKAFYLGKKKQFWFKIVWLEFITYERYLLSWTCFSHCLPKKDVYIIRWVMYSQYTCVFFWYIKNVLRGKLIHDGFANHIFLRVSIGYTGFNLSNKISLFMKYQKMQINIPFLNFSF